MAKVARLSDPHSHGGVIITAASRTTVNGIPVARVGDLVACPIHGVNPIATGSQKWSVEGAKVARVGSQTQCGAVITDGSPDTETA